MYRMVDCATWDDPWFAELEPAAKLLFLYLLTNRRSTPAGCFEITLRAMSFETGIQPDRIDAILPKFGERVRWWSDHSVIWIKNFYRRQLGDKPNPKYREGARRALAALPLEIRQAVTKEYPELRIASDAPSSPETPPEIPHTSPIQGASLVVGVVVEPEVEVGVEVGVEPEPSVPAAGDAEGKTYALVDAWAKANQRQPKHISGRERKETAAVFKPLATDYTAADLAGCVAWFKSDPFWEAPGKLTALKVAQTIPEWVAKGRPTEQKHRDRASPQTGPSRAEQTRELAARLRAEGR